MKIIIKAIKILVQNLILEQKMKLVIKSETRIGNLKLKLKAEEQSYKDLLKDNLEWINRIQNNK